MKKKKFLKGLALALSSTLLVSAVAGLSACGGSDPLSEEAKVKITFWGNGDENENKVFQGLVQQFNEQNKGEIYVNYELQPSNKYDDKVNSALAKRKATVDVLYINDESVKKYASQGYLEPLDEYMKDSTEIKVDEMWESSVNRYLYDVNTTTQDGPNAHYYGIPKDIGPTVIFYNEDHFTDAGVKVISVAAENLAAFNSGTKTDARGQSKSSLGSLASYTVQEKGYFVDASGQKWFNNAIPMSWDECVTLSKVLQTKQNELHKGSKVNYYGYFTEWWFNYGWSVGGNCIEYVETDDAAYNGGYWEFTLMDKTPNYIVADNAADFEINGTTYHAGEIISWGDKIVDTKAEIKVIEPAVIAAAEAGQLNVLPSQRDAFVEFVRVGQFENRVVDGDLNGYGICPSPATLQGDSGKSQYFKSGYISMLVDGRWNVVDFRKNLCETPGQAKKGGFEWDVAPLPMYKEYYEAGDTIPAGKSVGDVKVHGVEAGHSGSVALSINARSLKKEAAWKFVEFIGGTTGQTAQSKSGFAIPSQKELASNEEVFLQSTKCPRNSSVFIKAAEVQTPGDWWFLKDKLWITDWANVLNTDVRNGKVTLSYFESCNAFTSTNANLRKYTKK